MNQVNLKENDNNEIKNILKRKLKILKLDPTHSRISEILLLSKEYYGLDNNYYMNTLKDLRNSDTLENICNQIENLIENKDINKKLKKFNNESKYNEEEYNEYIDAKLKNILPSHIYKKSCNNISR